MPDKCTMESAVLLARQDIKLGNFPRYADLDVIPVKEKPEPPRRQEERTRNTSPKNVMFHPPFSPGKCLTTRGLLQKTSWETSRDLPRDLPRVSVSIARSTAVHNLSGMADSLFQVFSNLNKPVSKLTYSDDIEEDRLQRRVEEQRRHLYRMLYNTKRHLSQLISQLERTTYNHRHNLLLDSSSFSHLKIAYKSLIAGLTSFVRVSYTMGCGYMADLKQKVSDELMVLLNDLKTVCYLLDIRIVSLDLPRPAVPAEPRDDVTVPKLRVSESRDGSRDVGPLSPERDESLKAAIKSLVSAELEKENEKRLGPKKQGALKQGALNKSRPLKIKKKILKPKSAVSRYNPSYKRVMSAGPQKQPKHVHSKTLPRDFTKRPGSAPNPRNPLEVNGKLTPFITERNITKQAWMDKLGPEVITTPDPVTSSPPRVTSPPPTQLLSDKVISQVPQPTLNTTMSQLLDKLAEIEREDEEIRFKWLHLNYTSSKPGVVLPCATLLEPIQDTLPLTLTTCHSTKMADIAYPVHHSYNVNCYKAAMLQYLDLTKRATTARFSPWASIDDMVDQIVGGLVGEVVAEVAGTCDRVADNIYMSEFIPA